MSKLAQRANVLRAQLKLCYDDYYYYYYYYRLSVQFQPGQLKIRKIYTIYFKTLTT